MFDETPITRQDDAKLGQAWPLPPAEARAELARAIEGFLSEAASWHLRADGSDPPILALRVTAGTGKTRETLCKLARVALPLLDVGPVIYYAPTLQLARQALETFREIAPHVPARVVAGRAAVVEGAPLCRRWEEIAGIGGMVPSIQQAVCKRQDRGGRWVFADCYGGCRYQAQFDHASPGVVFTSHAYLRWQLPVQGTVSLRVIDEAFWPTLQHSQPLLVGAWLAGPTRPTVTDQLEWALRGGQVG